MSVIAESTVKQTQQQFAVGKARIPLTVSSYYEEDGISLVFSMNESKRCILHWGLLATGVSQWVAPPSNSWAKGTSKFNELAVRTPFTIDAGVSTINFTLKAPIKWNALEFVLYYPDEERYEKNGRYDYNLKLTYVERSEVLPETALQEWLSGCEQQKITFSKIYRLDTGDDLALARVEIDGGFNVFMVSNVVGALFLHWGVTNRFNSEWSCPPLALRDKISVVYDDKSVRTSFVQEKGLSKLSMKILGSIKAGPEAMAFLLYQSDDDKWIKYKGNDLFLPLFVEDSAPDFLPNESGELVETIIGCEAGHRSWTLMHRYNLCMDLLDRYKISSKTLMIIFVWLRYSAIRQLDWQRNYNTKPRDLAHSQRSLTYKLAQLWRDNPVERYWIRRIMNTVGRGGDGGQGQMIRDEILNIMHRNHIKETHGHFMEEWHQKLHNNTTPDDVSICKAYLEFLRSNGDVELFYRILLENGVSKERMQSYDRPIVTAPDFRAEAKDSLIRDFENYLGILQTVHGGAELSTAVGRAERLIGGELAGAIRSLLGSPERRIERTIAIRQQLAGSVNSVGGDEEILDLVYLDMALEDLVRRDFETINQDDYPRLVENMSFALVQMSLAGKESEELDIAEKHWDRLCASTINLTGLSALEGVTIAERLARVVQGDAAAVSGFIQPVADYIGSACKCDDWAVKLFAEETVRGGESFPLSKIVHAMLKHLRQAAGMGGWQVIGPGSASGRLVAVRNLHEVEAVVYSEPTVLITEVVSGDEEVPSGVVGIVTREAPDLVSHLSVRTRNLGVVFGACFEDEIWQDVQALSGKSIVLASTPTGGIRYKEGHEQHLKNVVKKFDVSSVKIRPFHEWAVPREEFSREILGGKSNNLNILLGKLPDWMKLPMSMAVPFGSFEAALAAKENLEFVTEYNSLIQLAEEDTDASLEKLRQLILRFHEPLGFKDDFLSVWQGCDFADTGWEEIWLAVKRVWASKWNNRAYFSRKHLGLAHEKLQMAVLVQQVVRADYAFVIHTVNPITGNPDEVFAEVVLGMGETLVGNYPGRSLGFTYNKNTGAINISSLPGKSQGLFGGGVIFRSDSNGEDLEGFAGAGLYDSYLAYEPELRTLDYTAEKLLVEPSSREELCINIGKIGVEVEEICGFAQDIEGAVQNGEYYIVQNRPQIGL